MSALSHNAQRLLAILAEAAAKGQECPTNIDLSCRFGYSSISAAVPWFKELEAAGLISVQRFQRARVVTIVETGAATSAPRFVDPHWRDVAPEDRAPKAKAKQDRIKAQAQAIVKQQDRPCITLPFRPFTAEEAESFDDALADGLDIEMAAIRAGRSRLCGYRQFHRICDELGEAPR